MTEEADTPKVDESTPQMSYSRMDSILTCGEKFRLQRKIKVPQREHWASVGGSAFHNVVEGLLKAEFQAMQSEPKGDEA
jgi:hypothetical protein